MDDFGQIVTSSLTRGGALCKPEGASIIIATWRILIGHSGTGYKELVTNEEMERLQCAAQKQNQRAVITRLYPDGHIEYRKAENGGIIRPRCLVKGKRTKIFKKEIS